MRKDHALRMVKEYSLTSIIAKDVNLACHY
jgi:hypothetical protein